MAVASWMLRDRTLRSGRAFNRSKSENEEDTVLLDANKDANENAYEILWNICKKQGLTDSKRLAYFNVFTKLIKETNNLHTGFSISKEDIMCCLKLGLVSSNTLVRAGGLRVIRYIINSPDDVLILNKLQIPNLIARSIDLVLKNDHERIQAFRLALKILNISPKQFSTAVTRSLVSLANSISENKDRMIYSCLAVLCQLCVLNPDLLIECYGQTVLLRCTLEISHSRINECLVGCLLFLLNKPETRNKANIQLDYLTSIYCDWQRKKTEKNQYTIYTSSTLSMLAALRTWTGVFHLCQPTNVSGIKAIVDVLHLDQIEVRKAILELLYEVFGLDHEIWTDEINVAVENIDPSKHQESWKLNEKFVAAEGKDVLPHKACSRPNLTEIHTALIVYTFLECGLLSALVEIIISTDAFLSIQAIILLGVILHLSHKLLPSEVIDISPGLPTLVHYITNGLPRQRTQALMAVNSLSKIHEMFKNRPYPNSLFLHQLMCHGSWYKSKKVQSESEAILKSPKSAKRKANALQIKDVDDHIKESGVFSIADPKLWNWNYINTSLKCQNESFIKLEDVQHKNYIKKLINFYKPSSNQYSVIESSSKIKETNIYTTTSFTLMDFLLQTDEGEPHKLLNDFLMDLSAELNEIVSNKNMHEILLSPHHVISTMSKHYFLIIGHLSGTHKGIRALDKCSIFQSLTDIVGSCKHEHYIKLIISSLNYNNSNVTRIILSKAMSSPVENVRMYATEFLLVLARCDVPNFCKWGLDLLVAQMYDENKIIAMTSINILHELCYDPVYLESLVSTRPSLLHLGDKGHLLLIRFLSTTAGFTFLSDANFVQNELENWEKRYNYRYVGLIEGDLHDSVTLHQRNEDGKYTRRLTNAKHKWKDVFIYPHLYGELSQHEKGFQALIQNGHIFKMMQCVQNGFCCTDAEILELKSSLWGLSNSGTSSLGLQLLEQENIIQTIVNIAQACQVLSIRATAFYCVCLISTTIGGANALAKHGWYSVRHNRNEKWPVIETEYLLLEEATDNKPNQDDIESNSSVTYESDETDSLTCDLQKVPFDVKSPVLKNKKASTLPLGTVPPSFEEKFDKFHLERKNTMESQSSDGSDDIIRSPGVPITRRSHQRSYSESFYGKKRHSSEMSFDGSEGNQKLSFQDAVGLAMLQSLHSYRRPDVSLNINSELEQPDFRKRFSSQDRSSSSPLSDFEAQNPPKLFSNASSTSLSSLSQRTPVPQSTRNPSNASQCVYQGISLPKALAQFLMISEVTTDRREERRGLRKRGSLSFSEMEQVKELEEENVVSSSSSENSESEDSKSLKKSKSSKRIRHNAATCIACCTKVSKGKRQRKVSTGSFRLRTDTESSYGNQNENSPISLKWRLRTQSENAFQNYTGGSGDSISNVESKKDDFTEPSLIPEAEQEVSGSNSALTLQNEFVSHAKVRRDVLKHVNRMCNPVWAKGSKQSLLQLKQSHPSVFQDVCLYSSVCNILSSSSCRVTARRFIQELFLDVTFVKLFDDAVNMLQQYAPSSTTGGSNYTTDTTTFTTAPTQNNSSTPSSFPAPAPPSSGDLNPTEPDGGVILPKTAIPNSKCTSPNNLTTLYENVPSQYVHFNSDCNRGPCVLDVLQNSSSQVQFKFNSEDKIPNS